MFCQKCGTEIEAGGRFCPKCGAEVSSNTEPTPSSDSNINSNNIAPKEGQGLFKKRKLCCPKCKSRNLQMVSNTEFNATTKGGGYSAGKGCCGYLAFGPLGFLCGSCGSKSKTTITSTSTNVWVCHDCGNRFRDKEEIYKDINNEDKRKKIAIATPIFGIILFILFPILTLARSGAGIGLVIKYFFGAQPFMLIFALVFVVIGIVGIKVANSKIASLYEELENIEKNAYTEE